MVHKHMTVSGGFCILLALLILTVPLPWLLSGLIAAGFHELGHILAIYLLGGTVRFGSLGSTSANLYIPSMSRGRELAAALGGPLFSLIALLFWRQVPRIALCAGFQLCYNLLPLYPMDGGRILSCLFGDVTCRRIAFIFRVGLAIFGLWLTFWIKVGIFPLLMVLLLLIRTK